MELRPYQQQARQAVETAWEDGQRRTLLVLPTGCGKTIVFAKITEDRVKQGDRVLILAHRGELLEQAADKLQKVTGLRSAVEKAEQSSLDSWYRVTVGSVQSLQRENRLQRFPKDYFGTIIVDEAHHCITDGYQRVLQHFENANVLGVTATPDRGDMKNLGQYFDSLAYEYTLPQAIKEGYLCPIRALTVPLQMDLSGVGISAGDFKAVDLGSALDPYLEQIATEMEAACAGRKTVVFLPLVKTSQKFRDILNAHGFRAAEVNGESGDRAEVLAAFDRGDTNVLCNSMLLCLDEETEILTDEGFIGINEMTPEHRVANWNFDGSVFFEKPMEIVKRPLGLDEHMVSIESRTINLRVTNTHRMIVASGGNYENWKKIPAEQLGRHILPACGVAPPSHIEIQQQEYHYSKHAINNTVYHILKSGQMTDRAEARKEAIRRKDERSKLKYTSPSDLSLDDCRFIGFWIADGSLNHVKKGGIEYTLAQSGCYPNIVHWVDTLLAREHIHHIKRYHHPSVSVKNPYFTWHLPRGTGHGQQHVDNGLYRLEPYLQKDGTKLFWGLNEQQFDALVEGYWYGDGFHGQAENGMPSSICAADTKKNWIDMLCAIGSVRGWRCAVEPIVMPNEKHNTQYRIRMIKNGKLHISEKTIIHHEAYAPETVWCVRTTSKNIITRRKGRVTVMGNTEGWDCPSVDCVVVLRPTKVRSLYCQMVGRGTRLHPGKEDLLLLDFLWHTERHELCHPASLICEAPEVAQKMTEELAQAGGPVDIVEAEKTASEDVIAQREEALAKVLDEMKRRKRKLVDPLQFEMSVQAEDLAHYVPSFGWEMSPPSEKQVQALEKYGILPDEIDNAGKAKKLLDRLHARQAAGLSTPKQIRRLEMYGFQHVGTWSFEAASRMISRIAAAGWKCVPRDVDPKTYVPEV